MLPACLNWWAKEIKVIADWEGYQAKIGEVVVLENVRINKGEKKNCDDLGQKYAALVRRIPERCFWYGTPRGSLHSCRCQVCRRGRGGLLLAAELEALGKALKSPTKPLVAIVAGSKVSTKLTILESLADKVDKLIVGGGILNTFLLAEGENRKVAGRT